MFALNLRRAALSSSSLLVGLLEYWKLDGNSNGINGNNGTNTSVTFATGNGKISQGAGMTNSPNSKIEFADATALKPTTAFGISMWVRVVDLSLAYGLLQNYDQTGSTSSGYEILMNGSAGFYVILGNNTNLTAGDGYINSTASAAVPTVNTWAHVMVEFDNTGSGYVKLYMDNVLKDTAVWNKTIAYAGNIPLIGARHLAGSYSGWLNGAIDEVGIWNRPFTAAERTALYNGGAGLSHPF